MKFVVSTIVSSLVVASAALGAAVDPVAVDLRPKFVAGQEDRFIVEMNSARQAKFVDSNVNRPETYRQTFRIRRKITEATDAGASIELNYEAVQVAIVVGDKAVSYDSEAINDSESELTFAPTVQPVLNKPITVKVDSMGRVRSVAGNQHALGEAPSMSLLGDDMFTRTLTPLYGLGRETAAAKPGETWTEERKSPSVQTGVVTTTRRYTLGAADGKSAKVTITGDLSLAPSEKATAANTRIEEQSVTGELDWSLTAGSIRNYKYNQLMKLRAETEGKQRIAMTEFAVTIKWLEVWPPAHVPPSATTETTGSK